MRGEDMAKVSLKFQDNVLKDIPLDKDIITVGRRPDNTIHIDNLAVSGFHAKIFREGERFVIEDMNSLNGTFVNGAKISKAVLKNGDNVLIGKHTLSFELPETPEGAKQPAPLKAPQMDETMVLDSALQQKMLNKLAGTKPSSADIIGGFIVIEGSTDRAEYELRDRVTTIGKDYSAGIRLRGFFTPKVAALVNKRKEGYFISPAGGKALRVNGEKIEGRRDLKDGDIVEIGGIKMQFYIKE